MTTATTQDASVLFCKAALAMKELSKADAQRLLKAAKDAERSAGDIAEALGFMTSAARAKVDAKVERHLRKRSKSSEEKRLRSDSNSKSKSEERKLSKSDAKRKSDAKTKSDEELSKSDSKAKRPRRKGKSSGEERRKKGKVGSRGRVAARRAPASSGASGLLLAGGALVFGLLVGVGAMFAFGGGAEEAVAKKDPVKEVAPAATAQEEEPVAPKKSNSNIAAELDFALSSAQKLQDLEKEKSALKLLDEFLTKHGEVHKAVVARKALVVHCKAVLEAKGTEARRLAKRGDHVQAAHLLAGLRNRLPASLLPRINAVALEIEQSPKGEVLVAKAEPKAEPAPRAEPREPVEPAKVAVAEEEPAPAEEAEPMTEEPAAPVAEPEEEPAEEEPVEEEPVEDEPAEDEDEGYDDEDEEEEEEDPELAGLAVDTDSPVALALSELVHAPHKLRKNGEFSVAYPMADAAVAEDFESMGFDKFQVNSMDGVSAVSRVGLECGVGSQRMARFKHCVPLDGTEFEIEAEVWFNYSNTRTQFVFLFGKKMGVNLGQQLVKVSKRGKMKALTPTVDRGVFREERLVKIKMTYKDGVFTVRCNGRKTAEKKVKANDLRGHFGMLARDVRLQIVNLSIKGLVDTGKL